jgi:hypothetical protein
MKTETTIYVKLLDEGTDVWRPVKAVLLSDGSSEITAADNYDPADEEWEFPLHSRVICYEREFPDGEKKLSLAL